MLEVASMTLNVFLRDLIIRRMLQKFKEINIDAQNATPELKVLRYLKKWQLFFDRTTQLWSLFTACGVFESSPGYSAHLSNALESLWKKIDALVSLAEEKLTVQSLFEELKQIHVGWREGFAFSQLLHFPSGRNLFAPRLMKGEGEYVKTAGLYKKTFRKMTVEKMQKFAARGVRFFRNFDEGVDNAAWTWKQAWVFVKERTDHFDRLEAFHFYEIQKADSRENAIEALTAAGIWVNGFLSYSRCVGSLACTL